MYSYYSTDKIKNLNREREYQQQQLNSNNISSSRPMTTSSPSTPIPNNGNNPRFNLNSNNKHSGFSSPTKIPQQHNNSSNPYQQAKTQTQHPQQQQQFHHTPIVNRKPAKYKISYSVKNTLNNTIVADRHCFGVNSLAFDYNRSILYSAGRDSTIKSYYINNNTNYNGSEEEDSNNNIDQEHKLKFKKSYDDHTDWVNDLFLDDNENILVSCSSDSTIKIWNTYNDSCINSLKFHDDYVKVLAYAPKVNYFASSGLDSHIKIWDLNICSISQSFSIDNSSNNNIYNSSNGNIDTSILKHITSNSVVVNNNNNNNTPSSENTTETSDTENDSKEDDNNRDMSLNIKPNLSNGNFRNIDNIDEYTPPSSVLNNNPHHPRNQPNTPRMNGNNNNNNNSNSYNNNSNICNNNKPVNNNNNTNSTKQFSPMFGSGSYLVGKSGGEGISIYSLAIAKDASFVVSGSTERAIRGWDVRSGQKIFKLKGHTDNIRSIVLNSDSTRCLSASSDGTVRLWDIGEQRCIQVFDDLHTDSVWTLATTDSFSHFYSGGRDGMIFLTDLSTYQSKLVCREKDPILKILNNQNDQSIWVSTTNSTIKNYGLSNFYDKNSSVDGILSSINEGDDQIDEVDEPKIKIQGRAGIIKNQILNNRRHVLTKDNHDNVQLWDITKGKEIESLGKVDFEKKLEEFNEVISIPKWFHVDTKTGSLFITLESPLCFSADAYLSNVGLSPPEDDSLINIGESILYSLFSKWLKEHNLLLANGSLNSGSNGLRDSNDSVNSSVSSSSGVDGNGNLQKSSSSSSLVSSNVQPQQLPPVLNKLSELKKNIFQLPPNTDVVISDETSGLVLFRLKIEEFTGREQIEIIPWLFDCLTSVSIPIKRDMSALKVGFQLESADEKQLSQTQQTNLTAHYYIQVKKMCEHIAKELKLLPLPDNNNNDKTPNPYANILPKAEEFIEICFQNKILLPHYTLGTVKSFFWKQNSPIPFTYRLKAQYKNEAEFRKYIKQLFSNKK